MGIPSVRMRPPAPLRLVKRAPILMQGDTLSREEFLRRWERMPDVKRAELIGGIVHMPSPMKNPTSSMEDRLRYWSRSYMLATPGTEAAGSATWLMLRDAPQPDAHLRILETHGGQSWINDEYCAGAPEWAGEICLSNASKELNDKKALYATAGVREYVVVVMSTASVYWHELDNGKYKILKPDASGIFRSRVFPGLWLDYRALLAGADAKVLRTLNRGLCSKEHAAFVKTLKRAKR